jgi:hypothetical protein
VRFSASHGRIDQLDQTLSPMIISIALSKSSRSCGRL